MVFSSILFMFIYLPVVLAVYYIVPLRWRNLWLFVVNLVFYAWGEPVYIFLMLFSICINYVSGILIGKYSDDRKKAHTVLVINTVVNLAMLFFFKYFDLVATAEVINDALYVDGLASVGIRCDQIAVGIPENHGTHSNMFTANRTIQSHCALGGALLIGGSIHIRHIQVFHSNGCTQAELCVIKGLHSGDIAIRAGHDLNYHFPFIKLHRIGQPIRGLVTGGDQLNVIGVVGTHIHVLDIGDLPGSAGCVILDRANKRDPVARLQDLQARACQVKAVVNGHAVIHIRFGIVFLHVYSLSAFLGNYTFKGHFQAFILFNIGTQALQRDRNCITVVEIGILFLGMHVQLLLLCLTNGCHAGLAVTILCGVGSDGQTVLKQLDVQIPVSI